MAYDGISLNDVLCKLKVSRLGLLRATRVAMALGASIVIGGIQGGSLVSAQTFGENGSIIDNLNIQVNTSSNSANIEIELLSSDTSRLDSEGIFTATMRARHADYINAVYENAILDTRAITNDGDWQTTTFELNNFTSARVYRVAFVAYNETQNAEVEQVFEIERHTPGEPSQSTEVPTVGVPNTGFAARLSHEYGGIIVGVITVIGSVIGLGLILKSKRSK